MSNNTLKKNINALIKSHKKAHSGKADKNFLMPLILSMIIQYCGIDQSKYHILASYGIRGIKQIGDLDINMNDMEWKKLQKSGMGTAGIYNNQMRYFIELPEISDDAEMEIFAKKNYEGFPSSKFSHFKLKNKFLIDQFGHQYYHINTLIEWKRIVHREKDLKALKLMYKEIKKNSRSKSGKEMLKTMGLNTKTQIDKTTENIAKIIDKW